ANVHRTMQLNFDAQVRLTEALLPLLRASAPSAIVNVGSTAGRTTRAGSAAYSASKAALAAWSDGLYLEEREHGVHVGLVQPGFIATEGFPADELRAKAVTRWIVSRPENAAEAIVDAGLHGKAERYVPRGYGLAAALRVLAPGLVRGAARGRQPAEDRDPEHAADLAAGVQRGGGDARQRRRRGAHHARGDRGDGESAANAVEREPGDEDAVRARRVDGQQDHRRDRGERGPEGERQPRSARRDDPPGERRHGHEQQRLG